MCGVLAEILEPERQQPRLALLARRDTVYSHVYIHAAAACATGVIVVVVVMAVAMAVATAAV